MTPAMHKFLDALDGYVDARIVLHEVGQEKARSEHHEPGVQVINRDEWQAKAASDFNKASKLVRQKRFELRQRVEKLVGKG